MSLTKEQKLIIIDYVLEEGSFSKGILECTPIGDAYEAGQVTGDDIYDFISAMNKREKEFVNNES